MRKGLLLAKYKSTDEALLTWMREMRSQNISLTGPILLEKAQMFAKELGDAQFKGNQGWLEKFKLHHGVVLYARQFVVKMLQLIRMTSIAG